MALISQGKGDVVIDNGAISFVPVSAYLITNQVGHQIVVHTVITGGQGQSDTLHGWTHLVKQFPPDVSLAQSLLGSDRA